MPLRRSFNTGDIRVTLHLAPQILACDVAEAEGEPPIAPTLDPAALVRFVPAGVLLHKAKQLDDGLLAALQPLVQRGAGKLPGRRWLLAVWAANAAKAQPPASGDAIDVLLGACRLGRIEAPASRRLDRRVTRCLETFLEEPQRSMPLGFYTWSDELRRIFRQERMLGTPLTDQAAIEGLRAVLAATPPLAAAYDAQRRLAVALSGPATIPNLRASAPATQRERAIFPAADSPEAALVREIADGALDGDLMDS